MPLTDKGEEIKGAMAKTYGPEKGEKVFYASKNKGTIKGVDDDCAPDEGGEGGEGGGGGGDDFVKSIVGPAVSMALSDEDMTEAMDRFDQVRDEIHKLSRRMDDCDAQDDRSSEGHAKAAREAPPDSLVKKFHEGEVGREDGV
jgi:hypothetical protein